MIQYAVTEHNTDGTKLVTLYASKKADLNTIMSELPDKYRPFGEGYDPKNKLYIQSFLVHLSNMAISRHMKKYKAKQY